MQDTMYDEDFDEIDFDVIVEDEPELEWYDSERLDDIPDEVLLYAYNNILCSGPTSIHDSTRISNEAKVQWMRNYIDTPEFRKMAKLIEYLR